MNEKCHRIRHDSELKQNLNLVERLLSVHLVLFRSFLTNSITLFISSTPSQSYLALCILLPG